MEIAVIKLGADGDVLRTIPVAATIKKTYPEAKITWITRGDISEIIKMFDTFDYVQTVPYKEDKKFDIVFNFDVDKEALQIIKEINAKEKRGFYENEGYASAYNAGGEYYLNTMFDDELKKSNKKTYQEMMFNAMGLEYNKELPEIRIPVEAKKKAEVFRTANNFAGKEIIGIHMGAGKRWPSKAWHPSRVEAFIKKASAKNYGIILFGGPIEASEQQTLKAKLESDGIKIGTNNPTNTKTEFISLLNLCDIVVCSDSLALHAGLLLRKKIVSMFFCTSPTEIEVYGMGEKLIAPKLYEFFPEKSDQYDLDLVKSISEDEVLKVIENKQKA